MTTMEIKVYQDLMGDHDVWAGKTRRLLSEKGLTMLNLIGSPGSGKTALLESTAQFLKARLRFGVMEGDIETTRDAERLAAIGIPASQLLSGGSCHLEARMVHQALIDFDLTAFDMFFVENVGNLVCPAEFDIGENGKVAVLSVTEGEEKPLKYPLLFREAKAVVLTKTDLIPYLPYDLAACRENLRQVNGSIPVFEVSCTIGRGIEAWATWLMAQTHR